MRQSVKVVEVGRRFGVDGPSDTLVALTLRRVEVTLFALSRLQSLQDHYSF